MTEDAGKVDLKLGLRHPHQQATQLTVHCQVKSGASYCSTKTKEKITLQNIDRVTMTALRAGTQPALLVWVPPPPSTRLYWHLVRSAPQRSKPITIPTHQYVNPTLLYDLAIEKSFKNGWVNLPTIPVRSDGLDRQGGLNSEEEKVLRSRAKVAYRELRQLGLRHPLVNELKVSRAAWRHVTRSSRRSRRRQMSLLVVPYLRRFVDKMPARYAMASPREVVSARAVLVERHFACWYPSAFRISGKPHTLILRICEQIVYPRRWQEIPLGAHQVKQSAVLTGWWCKED